MSDKRAMELAPRTAYEKKFAALLCSKIVSRWRFHVGQKSGVPCHLAVLDACQLFKVPCPPWIATEAGNRVTGARNQKPKRRAKLEGNPR